MRTAGVGQLSRAAPDVHVRLSGSGEGLAKVRDTAPNHERERVDPLKQMSIGGPFRSLTVAVRCYQPVE